MRQGVMRCPGCSLWKRWRLLSSQKIDRKCLKCRYRFRTVLDRKANWNGPGRGRTRQFEIRELPGYMPRHAIRKMLIELNRFERNGQRARWVAKGGEDQGFAQASKVLDHVPRNLVRDGTFERILGRMMEEDSA